MFAKFKRIDELSWGQVTFYTVLIDDSTDTEFELFDAKTFNQHENEVEYIYNVINQMAYRGAKTFYFKPERNANAINILQSIIDDNAQNNDFGIRLYCIRLTNNLVVLLNGDIKTKLKPDECPNVKKHFKMAIALAKKLDAAILDKELNLGQPNCLDEFETEIL